jgi:hypothetical protein
MGDVFGVVAISDMEDWLQELQWQREQAGKVASVLVPALASRDLTLEQISRTAGVLERALADMDALVDRLGREGAADPWLRAGLSIQHMWDIMSAATKARMQELTSTAGPERQP